MNTPPPFDVAIGLDRSDKKMDVHIYSVSTDEQFSDTVSTAPEFLKLWVEYLRQRFPDSRVAICVEQPAGNLISYFSQFEFITIYAINPVTLQKFREAFVTSRAKDDNKDALFLAELLLTHHDKLPIWNPEDPQTLLLQQLVVHRRGVVNERVGLTNRLQAILKQYFPQALRLCGEDLWRPMATDFLLKWPTIQAAKAAKVSSLHLFYSKHGSRSQKLMEERMALIQHSIPLTENEALLETYALRIKLIAREIQLVVQTIAIYEKHIAEAFAGHPDHAIFASLPGAGKTLAPRLLASMGTQRNRFPDAKALLTASGIAPVTKQSGKGRRVHRRYLCSKFLRQSFHEFAKESILHCRWAAAYYEQQKEKGATYHIIVRGLAYKWIRILWRCWQSRISYNNARYEAALERSNSPLASLLKTVPKPCKLKE